MAVPKANQKAVNKYVKNHYDRIHVIVPKGCREELKAHASAMGESLNGFIVRAMSKMLEIDNIPGECSHLCDNNLGNSMEEPLDD